MYPSRLSRMSNAALVQAVVQLEKQDAPAAKEVCELGCARLPHAILLQQRLMSLSSTAGTHGATTAAS